jgi:hypothetical protein
MDRYLSEADGQSREPGVPDRDEVRPDPAARRRPYEPPRLVVHGRLPERTLDVSVVDADESPSDRNAKEAFAPVDPPEVLRRVVRLPIETWSYKGERIRHLGPMAQDFAAAFGLGADDRHIHTLDAAGVALAAIQGLHAVAEAQAARLAALEREAAILRAELHRLRAEAREAAPVP